MVLVPSQGSEGVFGRLLAFGPALAMAACSPDPVSTGAESETASTGVASVTAASTSEAYTTSGDPDDSAAQGATSGTEASATTASDTVEDECPTGIDGLDDLGTFIGVENEWWSDSGVSIEEAECFGLSKELCEECFNAPTWLLLMQCTKVDAPTETYEVQLWSSVPEAEPMLDHILDAGSVRFRTAGTAAPNGPGTQFTVRSEFDELLLLATYEPWRYPNEPISDVRLDGWNAPFHGFVLRDEGCPWRTVAVPGGETMRLPYAVEFETDSGITRVFDRQQAVVEMNGVAYDVVVDSAAGLDVSTCGGDCVDSEVSLTIIRR